MKIYFIPGLAADKRIFKHIHLPAAYEPVYIQWIDPLPRETLREYALRLGEIINKKESFILVGLSLGGMIATEIAAAHMPHKLILISSIPCSSDLPPYFHLAGKIRLHKLLPISFFKSASLVKRFFTTETSADKKYLRQAIKESDPKFVKWAINAILNWKNNSHIDCIHIHGSDDRLLPARYTHPSYTIKGGGHLMVMNRADEINAILKDVL